MRITNMRGVDLNRFQFDYDLTWAALFMNAAGATYCRFGGRDSEDAEAHLTLPGLKGSMKAALAMYQRDPSRTGSVAPPKAIEEYPEAARFKGERCIHCHQVNEIRHQSLQHAGQWRKELIFSYPNPTSLGLTVDKADARNISQVAPGSPAAKAGMVSGGRLTTIAGKPITSFLDIQHSLHDLPESGEVRIGWQRRENSGAPRNQEAKLSLPIGWRASDISWRASMWTLSPTASVYGADLNPAEKKALEIPEDALAFFMGDYVPPPASRAGIHKRDVILGLEGYKTPAKMLQFNAWVRLNMNVGDRVVYSIIRDGKRIQIPMTLAERD